MERDAGKAGPKSRESASERFSAEDYWLSTSDVLFAVAVAGSDFIYIDFNPASERLTGYRNEDAVGRGPQDLFPHGNAQAVLAHYRQCVRERRPLSYVETLDLPGGTMNWSTTLSPVLDEKGRVVRILGRGMKLATVAEGPLLAQVELHNVLDALVSGIVILDRTGTILFANATWRRFGERAGVSVPDLGGKYLALCDSPDSAGLPARADVEAKLAQVLTGRQQRFEHPYSWGNRRFLLRACRVAGGGAPRATLVHVDITDVVAAQETLAHSKELLLQVQEEERARIALELHDTTSQHLVAIALGLDGLRRRGADPGILEDIHRALGDAQKELRALSYGLYPHRLSIQGLATTLRAFIDGFRRRTGLSVAATTSGDIDSLPLEAQRAVFRVVQESLDNAQRHAGASRVAVEIAVKRKGLRLTVVDDGCHGRPHGKAVATGVGIRAMQARFGQFGGDLTVTHQPFGTVVDGSISAEELYRDARLSGRIRPRAPRAATKGTGRRATPAPDETPH